MNDPLLTCPGEGTWRRIREGYPVWLEMIEPWLGLGQELVTLDWSRTAEILGSVPTVHPNHLIPAVFWDLSSPEVLAVARESLPLAQWVSYR